MKIRTGWFFFFLSMVTVLPYRIYQRLFSLEISMGFPKVGDHTLEILLVLFVLFTLLFIWSCSSDKETYADYEARPNPFAGMFALLMTMSVAVESVYILITQSEGGALNVSKIILAVTGLLGAVFFLILTVDSFRGVNSVKTHPYLSLALPIWALIRLTIYFMQFNTETGQENMFDSFALIGCLLFLYSQSRFLAGIEREKTRKSTFAFGFLAILTGFMCILPRYIGYILINFYTVEGVSDGIYQQGLTPFPTDLIFSLYVFAFLIGLYFNAKKTDKDDEETAPPKQEPELMPVPADPSRDSASKTPSYFDEVTGNAPHGHAAQGYYPTADNPAPPHTGTPYHNIGPNDYYTPQPPVNPPEYSYPPHYPPQPSGQPEYGQPAPYPQHEPGPGGYEPGPYSHGQHTYPPNQEYPR